MNLLPIENLIYEIRGQRVMMDFDLAMLYEVETRVLNQAVKRNIRRFPEDFMFQLTKDEWQNLISQFVTSSWGGIRKMPFAFTEQGVAMLSGLLNSNVAIDANIRIMRTFVFVRQFVANLPVGEEKEWQSEMRELKQYIEDVFTDYNDINEDTRLQLEQINRTLAEMQVQSRLLNKPRQRIGFFTEEQRKNKENIIE